MISTMWTNGCNFRKECHPEHFSWNLFLEPEIDISEMDRYDDFFLCCEKKNTTAAIIAEGAAVNAVAVF